MLWPYSPCLAALRQQCSNPILFLSPTPDKIGCIIRYPLEFINLRLNIISVLIQTNMEILGIKSPACEIVQKLPASVTKNRKNIFLNTVNGKKSWEWRKIDSKIISIHSRIRENHRGNRPGNFCPYDRKSCPYRRNNQFGAKNMGKGTYGTIPTSST